MFIMLFIICVILAYYKGWNDCNKSDRDTTLINAIEYIIDGIKSMYIDIVDKFKK